MNDRYIDGGASLIQLYGWLRETGEIDRLIDLVIEKVRDASQTERAKDPEPVDAESRLAAALDALRPFVDPESYTTTEEECRRNPHMDWCAVHSFRWPCPVGAARAALAGGGR